MDNIDISKFIEIESICIGAANEVYMCDNPDTFMNILIYNKIGTKLDKVIMMTLSEEPVYLKFNHSNGLCQSIYDLLNLELMIGDIQALKPLNIRFGDYYFVIKRYRHLIDGKSHYALIITHYDNLSDLLNIGPLYLGL